MPHSVRIATMKISNKVEVQAYLQIYYDAFPEWEREPEELVLKRHRSQDYYSRLLYYGDDIVGFSTLNPVPRFGYSMLNFMAVQKN